MGKAMKDEALSVRDKVFGVLAGFSALYCTVVAFAWSLPGARGRFLIALAVLVVTLSFVKNKKGVGLGILAFIALRFIWAGIVFLLQR
jgi:hypothetical protein